MPAQEALKAAVVPRRNSDEFIELKHVRGAEVQRSRGVASNELVIERHRCSSGGQHEHGFGSVRHDLGQEVRGRTSDVLSAGQLFEAHGANADRGDPTPET